jgi:outer membrane murein-binding lipoprotein Lpp
MPKSNPYGKIGKKVESVRAKVSKLSAELNALALQIAAEAKKTEAVPAAKKPAAKKPVAAKKPTAKKPGRPAKK